MSDAHGGGGRADTTAATRTNRLAQEASPYLQQHARNPVDWYPWGDEALDRARREDRPILLSIGYSACHWCHVMERESFEDVAIAKQMNDAFVCVKVDREERPDLDQIYQLVVQLMGRSGGWPLTVFLTPDQRPFFAGTYFPPTDRYGMPSFAKVLAAVGEAYRERRADIESQGAEIAGAIAKVGLESSARGAITPDFLGTAVHRIERRFDDTNGGFGGRPKFPNTMALDAMLVHGAQGGHTHALARATHALDAMRAGGIYDHLGGGFHRYSTDERWLVPHFEKMLYDNALLLRLNADAFAATGEARFADTAREIAAYVVREMTSPDGAFYATQDADSEGEEGKFFVWTEAEITAALASDDEARGVAIAYFGVTPQGNFEESGACVLYEARPIDEVAKGLRIEGDRARAALARAKTRLYEVREARPKPFRDEKVLASWNGLFAGALAHAGGALGDRALVDAAARAFDFVRRALLVTSGGDLRALRLVKDGVTRGPGFLDDHAFVADAALDLYEATFDPAYVEVARRLVASMRARFRDAEGHGFFFTPDDGEKLICRSKDPFDHAVPSGASIAAKVLLRLGTLIDETCAREAEQMLESMAGSIAENPMAFAQSLLAADRVARGAVDVLLVGRRDDPRTIALADVARRAYLPHRTLACVDPADEASVRAAATLFAGKAAGAEPVAYVCRGRACSLPVKTTEELAALLRG